MFKSEVIVIGIFLEFLISSESLNYQGVYKITESLTTNKTHLLTVSLLALNYTHSPSNRTAFRNYHVLALLVYTSHHIKGIGLLQGFKFNTGLYNSISSVHPPIFVILITLVMAMFLLMKPGSSLYERSQLLRLLLPSSIACTLLGSLWSQQEIFWEGFWNWDFVEATLAVLVIILYVLLHGAKSTCRYNLVLISPLLLIKLANSTPFMSSIHSFSGSPGYKISNIYVFLTFALLTSQLRWWASHIILIPLLVYTYSNYTVRGSYFKDQITTNNSLFTVLYIYILCTFSKKILLLRCFIFSENSFRFQNYHNSAALTLLLYLIFFTSTNTLLKPINTVVILSYINVPEGCFSPSENLRRLLNLYFHTSYKHSFVTSSPTIVNRYLSVS